MLIRLLSGKGKGR